MTSGSPVNPPGWSRWSSVYPVGTWAIGSIGSWSSVGTIGLSYRGWPSTSRAYQTGIGMPKKRWREMSQSPLRPATQFL